MNSDQLTPFLVGLNFKRLLQNLLKESDQYKSKSNWILDHQQKFSIEEKKHAIWQKNLIEEKKHAIRYKLRNQPKRTRSMRPQYDQEINNHYQRTTRKPKNFYIFAPSNNNRFDNWGG